MPHKDRQAQGEDGRRRSTVPDHVVEELLESERRERMLTILAEHDRPVVLDDLVRETLARERGIPPGAVSKETCTVARTEAYERHLPKLTAVDVIEYDSLVGTVELTDDRIAERVASLD